jgi:hypothetical protein
MIVRGIGAIQKKLRDVVVNGTAGTKVEKMIGSVEGFDPKMGW